MRRGRVLVVAVAAVAAAGLVGCDPATSTLTRPVDPVVLAGSGLPRLRGLPPGDLVGFAWTGSAWRQLPVQVDERKVVDLGTVYRAAASGVKVTAYADAGTHTGADPDGTFDTDDELVFMAVDAGGKAPATTAPPPGVDAATATDVRLTDPLGTGTAHAYLFRRTVPTLSPGAGRSYVAYGFSLSSGPYLTTYKLQDGPNPENSTITTASYRRHFSDRWLSDVLAVTASGASGADILERNKSLFLAGYCGRHENTFDDDEGAFVTNRVGPVRAIRSYIGANSGPWTQREHVFYRDREDVTTFLRVHSIPGIMDFWDLSSAAVGMTYRNNLNTGGVTVDGQPDPVSAGALTWESLDGPQGSVVQSSTMTTTGFSLAQTSWYDDDLTPATTQCTGDGQAIGQAGPRISATIPCTDPEDGCTGTLTYRRRIVYGSPGATATATDAAAIAARAATPLTAAASAWPPPPA